MIFVEGLRMLLVFAGLVVGLTVGQHFSSGSVAHSAGAAVGVLAGYVLGGVLGRLFNRGVGVATRKVSDVPASEMLAAAILGTAGLVLALIAGIPVLVFVKPEYAYFIVGAFAWILAYLGIRIGMAKAQQITEAFGVARRLAPGSAPVDRRALLLDTSAVMDRVIWVLGRDHLLPGDLVVPRFVLDELVTLAESPDPVAARKARRGLEVLDALREEGTPVVIAEEAVPEAEGTDAKVLVLADRIGSRVATCSANVLSQARRDDHVTAVDLRTLGADLAPDHAPGERMQIDLVREGSQDGQAVGYLPDGDMVVVNDASHMVGVGDVEVEVISTRRTSQGLLVFAHLAHD